jgi:hypothetical protein
LKTLVISLSSKYDSSTFLSKAKIEKSADPPDGQERERVYDNNDFMVISLSEEAIPCVKIWIEALAVVVAKP